MSTCTVKCILSAAQRTSSQSESEQSERGSHIKCCMIHPLIILHIYVFDSECVNLDAQQAKGVLS
jgi:hypothetical protein